MEEKIYEKSEADVNQTLRLYLEIHSKRFFDDFFLIFKQQEKDLENFIFDLIDYTLVLNIQ